MKKILLAICSILLISCAPIDYNTYICKDLKNVPVVAISRDDYYKTGDTIYINKNGWIDNDGKIAVIKKIIRQN